jgi:RNA polymerase sigma factor (sigma-70 family)
MEPSAQVERVGAVEAAVAQEIAPDAHIARVEVADGFTRFYDESRNRVARGLALTLGDVDLAEEAADEAMARAYERWPHVRSLDNPGGWAYRVGLNWARSVLRRRRLRGQELYDPGSTELPAMVDPAVHRALAELDVNHRAVIVCRFFLDWSVEDTAAALGTRPGTVKSRLHRATNQLRARLDHLRPEEL